MKTERNGVFRHWKFTKHYGKPLKLLGEFSYPDAFKAIHDSLGGTWTFGQFEACPTTGNLHFQGQLYFTTSVRGTHFKGLSVFSEGMSLAEARDHTFYCSKEETRVSSPMSLGTKPKCLGDTCSWDNVLDLAKKRRLEEIPARYQILHFNTLTTISQQSIVATERSSKSLWLWGPPRVGKSYYFRKIYVPDEEQLFVKLPDQWWDGYNGERFVLFDDFDQSGQSLGNSLKLWTDVYKTYGQVKCKPKIGLAHEQVLITSNYHPSEIWQDKTLVEAILARFIVRYINRRITEWPDQDHTDQDGFVYKSYHV